MSSSRYLWVTLALRRLVPVVADLAVERDRLVRELVMPVNSQVPRHQYAIRSAKFSGLLLVFDQLHCRISTTLPHHRRHPLDNRGQEVEHLINPLPRQCRVSPGPGPTADRGPVEPDRVVAATLIRHQQSAHR